jgi:hypothetical protein
MVAARAHQTVRTGFAHRSPSYCKRAASRARIATSTESLTRASALQIADSCTRPGGRTSSALVGHGIRRLAEGSGFRSNSDGAVVVEHVDLLATARLQRHRALPGFPRGEGEFLPLGVEEPQRCSADKQEPGRNHCMTSQREQGIASGLSQRLIGLSRHACRPWLPPTSRSLAGSAGVAGRVSSVRSSQPKIIEQDGSRAAGSDGGHFQRKWTKIRPKLSESFSTRWWREA